jgi:Na+-transporting methylmalonyl-CoA/oxaloacetate decarboxylase gamma subunit
MMSEDLQSAVLISAIGISLVFGVILILWALMTLVVRVAADGPAAGQKVPAEPEAEDADGTRSRAAAVVAAVTAAVEQRRADDSARARAAAAAVGAYLAGESRATDRDEGA